MPVPAGNHTDWPWPFSLIPRRWTAFQGEPPQKIAGNARSTKPIPDRGKWLISWPPYFAAQSANGWYFRIGARWDDVDGYYQFPSFKVGKYALDT